MKRRDDGKFAPDAGTHIDSKGYLTISAGPLRGMRVHRLVALAKFGPAALGRDAVVHHIDGDKQNPHPDNLQLMPESEHNAVSAKQAWYFRKNDIRAKKEWDDFFATAADETSFDVERFEDGKRPEM